MVCVKNHILISYYKSNKVIHLNYKSNIDKNLMINNKNILVNNLNNMKVINILS